MSLLQKIKREIAKGISHVAEKTEETARIAKLKIEISSLHKKIEEAFTEIGGRVYELEKEGKKDVFGCNEIIELIRQVKDYEKALSEHEKGLEELKKR
jgi:uncharacterized protein Yka (UPF0111/DUF47 family)